MKDLKKKEKGFTIIEVMIVLAIAGLIMLIVFLAVPALQRNSRNTQLRNDAGIVLASVNEYAANNNGTAPGTVCSDSEGNIRAHSEATNCNANGSSTIGNVKPGTNISTGSSMPTSEAAIVFYKGAKCDDNSFVSTSNNRAIAVGFLVETAGGTQPQCQAG